jgi:predicted SnoaL-like aldol condensation-catalyzing enzyme
MSTQENKAIVVRHLKNFLEQGQLELIDSYYAPDGSYADMWTIEKWKETVRWHHKTCPGFKVNLLEVIAEGDLVMAFIQFEVTYTLPEIPSTTNYPLGKPIIWRNVNVHRIVNGKIVFEQFLGNLTDALVKAGAVRLEKVA